MAKRKRKKKWIQKAVPPSRRGIFARKAKAAGMSTAAYARKVLKKGSRARKATKRQARLSQTLARMRRRRRK